MQIPVDKYHGCGNDFIILPWTTVADWEAQQRTDFIIQVCDRHTGIGADGCIFVKENPLEMIYYNQDGSRADMCGNGIRCFANYCFDNQVTSEGMYTVATLAGDQIIAELSQNPFRVQVTMGQPDFHTDKLHIDPQLGPKEAEAPASSNASLPIGMRNPFLLEEKPIWAFPLKVQGQPMALYSMYMGTIHTIVFTDDAFDPALERLGKAICEHPLFEKQTNVNFVQVIDDAHIKAATYERGCGMTLACGTGMCAAVVACLAEGLTGPHVDVEMKKGTLHIDIDNHGTVYLTGPARHIMKGTFDYEYNPSQNAA